MTQLRTERQGQDDSAAPGMLEVTVPDGATTDTVLDDAIEAIGRAADAHGIGILVTRIDTNRFVVRAHPQVPNGLVRRRL